MTLLHDLIGEYRKSRLQENEQRLLLQRNRTSEDDADTSTDKNGTPSETRL